MPETGGSRPHRSPHSRSSVGTTMPGERGPDPTLNMVSDPRQRLLHAYAKPDNVFMMDIVIALGDRAKLTEKPMAGKYVKYSFPFFLSEPIDVYCTHSCAPLENV